MQIRTTLVAIDYSPHAAEALRWGESLAQKYRAQLLLLHVLATGGEETTPHESLLVRSSWRRPYCAGPPARCSR
jgi:nucleotide-binding universal stress UspA family protein